MDDRSPTKPDAAAQRRSALSRWDNEGGAGAQMSEAARAAADAQFDASPLGHAELVKLRVRVIALENLVLALLVDGSGQQSDLVREMAEFISARPGYTEHPLTARAAALMVDLVDRAGRYRAATLT